jgi:histidine phosphotransferase ChpT
MSSQLDLRVVALLAARLCHELIGPVAAVANGAEFLDEPGTEADPEALALVGGSARRAAQRLQFYRFTYGYSGEATAAGPPPCELAAAYFAGSRVACHYGDEVRGQPLAVQKLGCNLLMLGAEALPRGGRLGLKALNGCLRLEAAGEAAALAAGQSEALTLATASAELSSRTIQAYFSGLLAAVQGWRLEADALPERLYITTTAAP